MTQDPQIRAKSTFMGPAAQPAKDLNQAEREFLGQVKSVVENNLNNENFGVSELAEAMNMSRSNLLRRVKQVTSIPVNQLIRETRLEKAMELLRNTSSNVSEVSAQVGFGSTSYFIKCFREHYGYPPGEVGDHPVVVPEHSPDIALDSTTIVQPGRSRKFMIASVSAIGVVIVLSLVFWYTYGRSPRDSEKSIAVLPFKNDSGDSSNLYFVNGLMESTLNNLQKVKDLKVISRTSAEKYRRSAKTIPEMARELNVRYVVEGSGQKVGDEILLNIQLIDGNNDHHLLSRQYKRHVKDIFQLQQDVAKSITAEISAIITPEEQQQIGKIPTRNLEAYDIFLKAIDYMNRRGDPNLDSAIVLFGKATEKDPEFALAYAYAVIAYYYRDIMLTDKRHSAEIAMLADKAVLYDPKSAECLVSKALYFVQHREFDQALPYLEKALEYNPNSMMVIGFLSDFYTNYSPNTSKYLEYCLMGVRLDIGSKDSTTASYTYLRLANAFVQTGFLDEAIEAINTSLKYQPKNYFSSYVKIFIQFAKDRNIPKARDLLIKELGKDTNRFDIIQEVAKMSYYMRDYPSAYKYFKRFIDIREARQLEVYRHENLKIAVVLSKMGQKQKADEFAEDFKKYADDEKSIYKHLNLMVYYVYRNKIDQALDELELFSKEDHYMYWVLLGDLEPLLDPIENHPRFKELTNLIDAKFWAEHDRLKERLVDNGWL